MNIGNLWVIADDFSDVPWQGEVYTSSEEAVNRLEKSPEFKHLKKIMLLKDFMWQLKNGKPSPRINNLKFN
jgi:hypothetical protein